MSRAETRDLPLTISVREAEQLRMALRHPTNEAERKKLDALLRTKIAQARAQRLLGLSLRGYWLDEVDWAAVERAKDMIENKNPEEDR